MEIIKQQTKELSTTFLPGTAEYHRLQKPFNLVDKVDADYVAEPETIEALAAVVSEAYKRSIRVILWTAHFRWAAEPFSGLHIYASKLTKMDFDELRGTITVGAGVRQPELDQYLIERKRVALTGAAGNCSVVGLALVGGYGWLSAMHGSALRSMVSAKVVLADGGIVTCSQTENEDLFWAIRGTSGSFGIVAEATFRTFEQRPNVFWATVSLPAGKLDIVLPKLRQVQQALSIKASISARLEIGPEARLVLRLFYNGDLSEGQAQFEPLLHLPDAMQEVEMIRYDRIAHIMAALPDHTPGTRNAYTGVDLESLNDPQIEQICEDYLHEFKGRIGIDYAVLGLDIRNIASVEGGVDVKASPIQSYLRVIWSDSMIDEQLTSSVGALGKKWRSRVHGKQAAYPPFCHYSEMSGEELYGDNLDRLRELKVKYDPKSTWLNRGILA